MIGNPWRLATADDGVHVGHLAVEMDGHDRLRPRRDRRFQLRRIHGERVGFDVHKNRPRAGVADRRHAGDESEGHGDHLVARADAGGEQRKVERARAGIDGDRVLCAAIGGELALEAGDFLAEDILRPRREPSARRHRVRS